MIVLDRNYLSGVQAGILKSNDRSAEERGKSAQEISSAEGAVG